MSSGKLYSIIPIYEELLKGTDSLVDWAETQHRKKAFHQIDNEITQRHYATVAEWAVAEQQFKTTAQEEFLGVADSWLVAKALSTEATIVTHERYDANIKKRILIPNACKAFDIPYINTIQLMRKRGARFN